jgi:hypothetical protein
MVAQRSNIEAVAREICARLYARHWTPSAELDADIDRHWHIVAALVEGGLMDETGGELAPYDLDRQTAAIREWRSRHPDHVVPPRIHRRPRD